MAGIYNVYINTLEMCSVLSTSPLVVLLQEDMSGFLKTKRRNKQTNSNKLASLFGLMGTGSGTTMN